MWVSAPPRHTSVVYAANKTHHPCGRHVDCTLRARRTGPSSRLATLHGPGGAGRMLSAEPPPGRRHPRARARQGVLAFATPALRSSDLRRASPTPSTARLMTKTTHGLAAADVSLYKTASRGYHDRSPITSDKNWTRAAIPCVSSLRWQGHAVPSAGAA